MIKRYSIALSKTELVENFKIDSLNCYQPVYNAGPGQTLPIIKNTTPNEISYHSWGIIPENASDSKAAEKNINAYAKTIKAKAPFCDLIQTKRCIIPADGFFIWDNENNKIYRYISADRKPLAFAGVWEDWGDEHVHFKTFSVITTESNSFISKFSEHMPAILPLEMAKLWLESSLSLHEVIDSLRPYSPLFLKTLEVDTDVNDLNNNNVKVITAKGDIAPGETLSLF